MENRERDYEGELRGKKGPGEGEGTSGYSESERKRWGQEPG